MKNLSLDMTNSVKIDLSNLIDSVSSFTEGRCIYFVRMNTEDMRKRISVTPHELIPFVVVAEADNKLMRFYITSSIEGLKF